VSSAIVGLIGVLVGALIAGTAQWLMAIRDELASGVVSARLVTEELERRRRSSGDFVDAVWQDRRESLATVLGEAEWRSVAAAYRGGPEPATGEMLDAAIEALGPLTRGKRRQVGRRARTLFGR
jgi:hypothetical protein